MTTTMPVVQDARHEPEQKPRLALRRPARVEMVDNLDLLLAVLPPQVQEVLRRDTERETLLEIVLDLGRVPEARYLEKTVQLRNELVNRDDLTFTVARVGAFTHDNRAGIPSTLHRISAIRNRTGDVIGLTCRVGRAVFGTVDIIKDLLVANERSLLLLGPPGVGKTTLLREAARCLAEEADKRVVVVDTSNEIAGDGDIAHPSIGRARRMQVPSPELQHTTMIEAVENHMPEIIVVDEIGTEAEADAARTIAERGVRLIATAHGGTLENLILNPALSDLVGGIQSVTLGDLEARRRGTQKTILERKAPPTFDVLIEIRDRDHFVLHTDVVRSVDTFLRGRRPPVELRSRVEDGEVEISPASLGPPPSSSPALQIDQNGPRRIYPYGVNRHRLDHAIRELRAPACLVGQPSEADTILTVKGQIKRLPKALRILVEQGTELSILRNDTVSQMSKFLRDQLTSAFPEDEAALSEAHEAIQHVLDRQRRMELSPQPSRLRRLQHGLVKRYGLESKSHGEDPSRYLVVYPLGRDRDVGS